MQPDVTVVIVSWNTKQRLERCLAALALAVPGGSAETVVVDNGSTDGSQSMVAERFPGVRLIQNQDNLGYGRAANAGVKAGTGRYALILNSDCELAAGALKAMAERLDRDPAVGGVFCTLQNPDGSLQPSVHDRFPSPWGMLGDLIGWSSLRFAVYRRPWLHRWLLRGTLHLHKRERNVEWGGGACFLVRRSAFDSVGGFDERFFMYYEDIDLCHRLRAAGHRLRYAPAASAVHHWGMSTRQAPAAMLYESLKSRTIYFEKHFPEWGGAWAKGIAIAELSARSGVLACAATLSRRDSPLRTRAATAANCLARLRALPVAGGRPNGTPAALTALLILAVTFSLVRYAHDLLKFYVQSPFIDFAHYYTYSSIVALGQNPFDPPATAAMDAQLGIRRAMSAPNYPPLFYVLMQPWVRMPYGTAAAAWLLFNQACLLMALALMLMRERGATALRLVAGVCVVLNFQPLYENFALGQSNVVLLLLVTAAWWGAVTGRIWMVAVMLGIAVQIKVQYAFVLVVLWWMGCRRACAGACAAVAGGTALGWMLLGADHYRAYVSYLASPPPYLAAWTANLSLRGTVHRLVGEGGGTWIAESIWLAAVMGILIAVARSVPRSVASIPAARDWVWGLGLAVMVGISPLMEEHHLVVLLFPLMLLLLKEPQGHWTKLDWGLLIGSVLLLGSLYSLEQFPVFHRGLWSILMAGKLLGVGCLGWALQRRIRFSAAIPGADRVTVPGNR